MNTLPKQYVIHCPEIFWRTDSLRERIERAGLDVEWWRGFHGATLGIAPTIEHFDSPGWNIGGGIASLVLSYLGLARHLLSTEEDPVVIYEDDVCFSDDYATKLRDAIARAPADWEMLFVGYDASGQAVPPGEYPRIARPYCTHGIVYRQSALRKLLNIIDHTGSPIDVQIIERLLPYVRYYCLRDPICWQQERVGNVMLPKDHPESTLACISWKDIDGWIDYENIYNKQVQRVSSGKFVELGCWLGRSSAYMASLIKQSLKPITFYAVDTFKGTQSDPHMSTYGASHNVLMEWRKNMVRCGVSRYVTPIVSYSAEAASQFADESVDFCFIDANHDAGACLRDIVAWYPKIKSGGTLAGHDIDLDTVLTDLRASGLDFTVDNRSWVHVKNQKLRSREDIMRRNDARVSRSSRAT